jgi:hypothetical protein
VRVKFGRSEEGQKKKKPMNVRGEGGGGGGEVAECSVGGGVSESVKEFHVISKLSQFRQFLHWGSNSQRHKTSKLHSSK